MNGGLGICGVLFLVAGCTGAGGPGEMVQQRPVEAPPQPTAGAPPTAAAAVDEGLKNGAPKVEAPRVSLREHYPVNQPIQTMTIEAAMAAVKAAPERSEVVEVSLNGRGQ